MSYDNEPAYLILVKSTLKIRNPMRPKLLLCVPGYVQTKFMKILAQSAGRPKFGKCVRHMGYGATEDNGCTFSNFCKRVNLRV